MARKIQVALVLPLIPNFLGLLAQIVQAARDDPDTPAEEREKYDALDDRLIETAAAVEALEIRDV